MSRLCALILLVSQEIQTLQKAAGLGVECVLQKKAAGRKTIAANAVESEIPLVPGGGLEPPHCFQRRILNPLRLPIPPSRLVEGRHYSELSLEFHANQRF